MLSKSQAAFIKSLHHKKYRKEHGYFLAEGIKTVTEFAASDYCVDTIFCTRKILPKLAKLSQKIKLVEVSDEELSRISVLQNPQGVLALIKLPEEKTFPATWYKNRFTLALDDVQDPGNLGTIIRTADWFGFTNIVCSEGCVEAHNPKVVQATMGSLARVAVQYASLETVLQQAGLPVYGAGLDGETLYDVSFGHEGFLVLGNEGNGLSPGVQKQISKLITIPRYGTAESLNVAVAAAICCAEIRRRAV